ncbi:MAG: hypothetical protein KC457_18930, partial [Myxococcales bacterium]|nr:hypothetical protein [Myxococcales bacterium]
GRPFATLAGHEAPVDHLALSADGTRLASVDRSRSLRIWDPRTAASLAVLETQLAPTSMFADSLHVALVAADGEAELWSIDERRLVATLALGQSAISALAVSGDGSALAVARPDGVEFWRIDAGNSETSEVGSGETPEVGSGELIGWFRVPAALALSFFDSHAEIHSESEGADDLLIVDGQGVISRWPGHPSLWLRAACDALPTGTVLPTACPLDE